MSCVQAHANVSCFRLQMYFRHNQCDLPPCLLPSTAAPAQCALMALTAAVEGTVLCQQLLMGIAVWSWVPALSPCFATGTRGPGEVFLWALCLSLKGTCSDFFQGLKIHPMIRDDNSSFLERRLGGVCWSLAGMFCQLLLGSVLKSIKAALAMSWHSQNHRIV